MHDDPTRVMGQPEEPGGGRPHGNMRLLVAGLIAVIVGLVVAILVIASGDGGEDTTSSVPTITTEPTETEPTEPTTETTQTETTEPTSEETTTETTTTAPPTTPEEEGTGSGGIPAE